MTDQLTTLALHNGDRATPVTTEDLQDVEHAKFLALLSEEVLISALADDVMDTVDQSSATSFNEVMDIINKVLWELENFVTIDAQKKTRLLRGIIKTMVEFEYFPSAAVA